MVAVADISEPSRSPAGGAVLSLLASPLCVPVLRAHLDEPLRLPDLHERIGAAAQTTLRGQVGKLRDVGALERQVRPRMPYTVENELTETGRDILDVAEIVEAWLARAPRGPIALGSEQAKGAIRTLVGGWRSTVLRALAIHPLSLTELDSAIPEISYPSIERRISAMRAARQVEALAPGEGGARPYVVTDWARQAVRPLVAAGRCERARLDGVTEPLAAIDVEAALLLLIPLMRIPDADNGSCLLAIHAGGEEADPRRPAAGVSVDVEDGRGSPRVPRLDRDPHTWALGSVEAWVEAILDGRLDRLRVDGEEPGVARSIIAGLHAAGLHAAP